MASHNAECWLTPDDPSVAGHFPGNPIIPGAVLLREVLRVVSADGEMHCCAIQAARFLHPARPGDRLVIVWEEKPDGEVSFTCSTGTPERRVLVGTLRMRAR
jgi:3-hydroxyacyl-[acyl-carrier-protein] dehydratase